MLLLLLHTPGERERTKRMDDARRSSSLAVVVVRSMTHAHVIYYGSRTRDDDTVRKVQYGRTSINPCRHWWSSNRRRSPMSAILDVCAYSGARRSLLKTRSPAKSLWTAPTTVLGKRPRVYTDGRTDGRTDWRKDGVNLEKRFLVAGGSIDSKYTRTNNDVIELRRTIVQ